MANINIELLEISDEQAVAAIEMIAERLSERGAQGLTYRVRIFDGETERPYAQQQFREYIASILSGGDFLIRSLAVVSSFGNNAGSGNASFQRESNGSARASINLDGAYWDQNPAPRIEIGVSFQKAFAKFHKRRIFAQLPPEISDFYTKRESALVRLEEIATKAAENTEAHRQRLDELFEKRRGELEVEYRVRVNNLLDESDKKSQALNAREEALKQRETDLEKADNTHARRKLRQDLKAALKERHAKFTLTAETENKRNPVFWSFVSLMVVALSASIYFGWSAAQPPTQGVPPWFPTVRLGLSLAGFAGAAVYFIRWQDRWSQIHADEEFALKRLDLDVDRASWLVEVLLEWRGEDGREIPPELIEKLAQGLFDPARSYPAATHPVEDALASLLASPASLKLRLPGGEVNLDKKSINRARAMNEQ